MRAIKKIKLLFLLTLTVISLYTSTALSAHIFLLRESIFGVEIVQGSRATWSSET